MGYQQVLKQFGLNKVKEEEVELNSLYVQDRPNDLFPCHIQRMPNLIYSPHVLAAEKIIEYGEDWFKKNWKETSYGMMMEHFGKKNYPEKLPRLIRSIKEGYLRKGFEDDFIVILNEPFARTRYMRLDRPREFSPEILSGHHRAGILLALGKKSATVIVAQDARPGSLFSKGKIHDLCIKK